MVECARVGMYGFEWDFEGGVYYHEDLSGILRGYILCGALWIFLGFRGGHFMRFVFEWDLNGIWRGREFMRRRAMDLNVISRGDILL